QEQCEAWLERTGNYKVHEKTKKRPIDVFTLEKPHLISISKKRILSNNESITKTILKDNTLQFQSNYYLVPIGTYQPRKTTKVRITTSDTHLYAYDMKSDRLIAQHPLTKGKGKLIKDSNHGREEDKRQKL
ncbi:IS21 family transposase, partial [Marinilactibacillus psychrotolerans]